MILYELIIYSFVNLLLNLLIHKMSGKWNKNHELFSKSPGLCYSLRSNKNSTANNWARFVIFLPVGKKDKVNMNFISVLYLIKYVSKSYKSQSNRLRRLTSNQEKIQVHYVYQLKQCLTPLLLLKLKIRI